MGILPLCLPVGAPAHVLCEASTMSIHDTQVSADMGREIVRYAAILMLICVGIFFWVETDFEVFGMKLNDRLVGGFLVVMALLGLFGVNIFIGGPLDRRLDRLGTDDQTPDPLAVIAIVQPDVHPEEIGNAIGKCVVPHCQSGTLVCSNLTPCETRFRAISFVFGDPLDLRLIGDRLSEALDSIVYLVAVVDCKSIQACWRFEKGTEAVGYAEKPETVEGFAQVLPVRQSASFVEDVFRNGRLGFMTKREIEKILFDSSAEHGSSASTINATMRVGGV
jgi:hypothetical protein